MRLPRVRVWMLMVVILLLSLALAIVEKRWNANRRRRLQPCDGPFHVVVCTFQGPQAQRRAYLLGTELRRSYGLPVYCYEGPVRNPGASLQVGSKTASRHRVTVMVGNAKTLAEARKIRDRVKRIAPKSLQGISGYPANLRHSYLTTNPIAQI